MQGLVDTTTPRRMGNYSNPSPAVELYSSPFRDYDLPTVRGPRHCLGTGPETGIAIETGAAIGIA